MTFEYNGALYTLPDSLADITLGQFMDYMDMYGYDLDAQERRRETLPAGEESSLESSIIFLDRMVTSFAHFVSPQISLEEVKQNIQVSDIVLRMSTWNIIAALEKRELIVQDGYEWAGEVWVIKAPTDGLELSALTHAQFSAIMNLAKLILQVAAGDWRGAAQLCAAYFRKMEEGFSPELSAAGSERVALMQSLPMNMALATITYLEASLVLFRQAIDTHLDEETSIGKVPPVDP